MAWVPKRRLPILGVWRFLVAVHLSLQRSPFAHLYGEWTTVPLMGAAPPCVGRRPQLKSDEFEESTVTPKALLLLLMMGL